MVGPTEENEEMPSSIVVEPTPITPTLSPGELAVLQEGPEFPMEKSGMIFAVCRAAMTGSNQVAPRPPPQELETKCGALLQSGLDPSG